MQQMRIVAPNPMETDAMFDTSPRAMAARHGWQARTQMVAGLSPYGAARLAAHWAFVVDPSLRLVDRDVYTVEVRGQRCLTALGAAFIDAATRSQVVH